MSSFRLLSSDEYFSLTPRREPAVAAAEMNEPSLDEETEDVHKYAWVQEGTTGAEMPPHQNHTKLDDIMATLPALPDDVRHHLFPKFEPNEYVPTPLLCDLSKDVIIRHPRFLAHKNPHPWDQRIVFVESSTDGKVNIHKYFVDGSCENLLSTTTLVHAFFPGFDADAQSVQTFNSKTFATSNHRPSYEYNGCKSPDDIKAIWAKSGEYGTLFHANVEAFWNRETEYTVIDQNIECFRQFTELFTDPEKSKFCNWTPYRTEMSIFDPETGVTGQIDFVGLINGTERDVVIIDWKRSKNISDSCFERFQGKPIVTGKGVLSHLENCNWITYNLQQAVYKYILEKHYGLNVKKIFLVQVHPKLDQANPYKCASFGKEVLQMMACRKLAMKLGLEKQQAEKVQMMQVDQAVVEEKAHDETGDQIMEKEKEPCDQEMVKEKLD